MKNFKQYNIKFSKATTIFCLIDGRGGRVIVYCKNLKVCMLLILHAFLLSPDFFLLRYFILTLKAPIATASDDKFCDIFPNFRK